MKKLLFFAFLAWSFIASAQPVDPDYYHRKQYGMNWLFDYDTVRINCLRIDNKLAIDSLGRIWWYNNTAPTLGEMLLGNGTYYSELAIGSTGEVLTVSGGTASWEPVTGGTIGGFTDESVVFSAADGTLTEDNDGFKYTESTNTLSVGDGAGGDPGNPGYILALDGTNIASIHAQTGIYFSKAGTGTMRMEGDALFFQDTGGDEFRIGRAPWSADMYLYFPAALPTANQELYASSVAGADVTLGWRTATTGTVTSFTATDGNGFDFTVTDPTTTPTLTLTTSLTTGRVPFIGTGSALDDDQYLLFDESDRTFSVGSDNTENYNFNLTDQTGRCELVITGTNSKSIFGGRYFNGTYASKTAALNNDVLTEFAGLGYKATGFPAGANGGMQIVAGENFTDTQTGTYLQWFVSATGGTTTKIKLRLGTDGYLRVNGSTAASYPLDVSGDVNISTGSVYRINGTQIAASNLSNGTTGSGSVMLAASPTTTGTLTAAAISANSITLNSAGNTIKSGTSTDTYRSTNAGSNLSAENMFDPDNSISSGTVDFIIDATGFGFLGGNSANRRIERWSIKLNMTDNTAGTEDADLDFYGQTNGAAAAKLFSMTSTGNIYGTAIHNNSTSPTGTANQYIASGTYTPTLTNVTNVAASTAYQCQWMRVGNVVTVSGQVDIDATLAASAATELGISLPLASNFTANEHLGGNAISDAVASLSARMRADATNDRCAVVFKAISQTNDTYSFTFTYVIL